MNYPSATGSIIVGIMLVEQDHDMEHLQEGARSSPSRSVIPGGEPPEAHKAALNALIMLRDSSLQTLQRA